MGQIEEAIGERKKAVELDPLSPLLHSALGEAYYHARRFDLSIAQNTEAHHQQIEFVELCEVIGVGETVSGVRIHRKQNVRERAAYRSHIVQIFSRLDFQLDALIAAA